MSNRRILGELKWMTPSEDYEGQLDHSRVTVYEEDGKCFLELACNDVERRLQVYPPSPNQLVVDAKFFDRRWPINADTDREVASVAETLSLRLV